MLRAQESGLDAEPNSSSRCEGSGLGGSRAQVIMARLKNAPLPTSTDRVKKNLAMIRCPAPLQYRKASSIKNKALQKQEREDNKIVSHGHRVA